MKAFALGHRCNTDHNCAAYGTLARVDITRNISLAFQRLFSSVFKARSSHLFSVTICL